MDKLIANSIDLDILCIIHVHELFIDERPLCPGERQIWVVLARLVGDLFWRLKYEGIVGYG